MEKRDYLIDNCKAIAIFFVVFCHVLEQNVTKFGYPILLFIYTFHIPIFVFFSGYLAKYDPKKMLNNIVKPYLVFQIIAFLVYHHFENMPFMMASPYHSFWYLISLFCWYLLIPFFKDTKHPIRLIICSIIFSLIIGYDTYTAQVFSLSRTIFFFPLFLLGYFCKNNNFKLTVKNNYLKILLIISISIIVLLLFKYQKFINVEWFYGYQSYEKLNYNWWIRLLIYIPQFLWILFFINFVPKKKLFISKIGEKSMQIYLFHYMIIYLLNYFNLLNTPYHYVVKGFIVTILLTFILSTKPFTMFINLIKKQR